MDFMLVSDAGPTIMFAKSLLNIDRAVNVAHAE